MSIMSALKRLRADINASNKRNTSVAYMERLNFWQVGGHFHIEFYGDPEGESYYKTLEKIAEDPVASAVASICLGGPDRGANGTRSWNLEPLARPSANLPNLRHFSVQQIRPTDHNRTIIGDIYEEDGVIAKIARKTPNLTELIVPSAPNSEFFGVKLKKLAYLNVDAGYDTQNFIRNLSQSAGFRNLKCLEWGEYCETYMDGWRQLCTPFEDYQALFSSEAFPNFQRFVFKNPVCSEGELAELKSLRPDIQILVVRGSDEYVRRA
jgi:hypothetical protein